MYRLFSFWSFGFIPVIVLVFSGCSGNSNAKYGALQSTLKPISEANRTHYIPEYRLGLGDVIDVKFFRNPEFNEQITIRPDGRISLPRVGELLVAGMTPAQLDSVITKAYAEFVVDPDVTVIVRQFSGNQIYVLGQVTKPGGYPIQKNMTLIEAVAAAGGATNSAKLGSIMLLRKKPSLELVAYHVSLSKTLEGDNKPEMTQNNPLLHPQDIIYIPKTAFSSTTEFMSKLYDGFLTPLDLYLRALLYYNRN